MSNNYVVCLKHGTKYGPEYVNTLHKMVSRNLTIKHKFVCYTENSNGIDDDIEVRSLPSINTPGGWWYKPMFFNPDLMPNSTLLFLDLDIIIFDNIDRLFTHKPGKFCIIRDFNRKFIKSYNGFNSSVFRLDSGSNSHVYHKFTENPKLVTTKFRGDQDWIKNQITHDYEFWPDEWIQSYKWEMRTEPMKRDSNGKRYLPVGNPIIPQNSAVAVFHGDPNPHDCKDPWCVKNWR